jgi:hypothetical protein
MALSQTQMPDDFTFQEYISRNNDDIPAIDVAKFLTVLSKLCMKDESLSQGYVKTDICVFGPPPLPSRRLTSNSVLTVLRVI